MTDYTYNYNKIPSALAQRQALSAEDKPKGIASKTSGEASATGEPDFYDRMLDLILPYFSSKEAADKALSNDTPDREALKLVSISEFEGLSQEARDAIEQSKQTRIGPADRGDVDVAEEVIRPKARTEPAPEDIKDVTPLPKAATDDGGLMSRDTSPEETMQSDVGEAVATPDGGLMSKTKENVDAVEAYKSETMEVQKLLGVSADGQVGKKSMKALNSYQKREGLPVTDNFYDPAAVESLKLRETQSRLKELGFYGNKVDGVTGKQTRNAIKTFQHKNGLAVTGTADEQTRLKLAKSKGLVSQPKPQTTLLSFISKGEGGYGAANNGTTEFGNLFAMTDGYYSDTYNKPLTEMTVNEIMNAQVGTTGKTTEELLLINPKSVDSQTNREFFAVGAYQIIPATMWSAAKQGAIDANDIFSPKVQDKISMDFLAGSDRPMLQAFLAGKTKVTINKNNLDVTVEGAMLDLAKQWASAPAHKDMTTSGGRVIKKGDSYYGSGNKSQHTVAETRAMLLQARDENTL